jgi:hypothetical protein
MVKTDINNAGSKGGRSKNKLKVQLYAPKIEPKYKKESPFSKYSFILSALLSVVMVVLQSTSHKSLTLALLVTIIVIVTVALSFAEMKLSGGNYILAVELVNSLDVVSWAYNNGLAILMLPGEQLVLYDTMRGELYFLVKGSVQEFMTTKEQKKIFKLSVIARSSLPHNINSKEFKIEIIEGVVEAPSINNEKAVMRYTGTIIKADLKTRCLIKLSDCAKKITDFLRNTYYVKPY